MAATGGRGLGPEESRQATTAQYLAIVSPWMRDPSAPFLWFHVPNERPSRAQRRILGALGVVAGVADFVFVRRSGSIIANLSGVEGPILDVGFIEKKAPGKRKNLSDPQRAFRAYCLANQIKHAITVEPEEDREILIEWGFLDALAPQLYFGRADRYLTRAGTAQGGRR